MKLKPILIILIMSCIMIAGVMSEQIQIIQTTTINNFDYLINGNVFINNISETNLIISKQHNYTIFDKIKYETDDNPNSFFGIRAKTFLSHPTDGLFLSFNFSDTNESNIDGVEYTLTQNVQYSNKGNIKGGSLLFNETDGSSALIPHNSILNLNDEYTIDMWYYNSDTIPSGGIPLLSKMSGVSDNDGYQIILFTYQFRFYHGNGTDRDSLDFIINTKIYNKTNRVTITVNGANVCAYFNSESIGCQVSDISSTADNTKNVKLGHYLLGHASLKSLNGGIELLNFYNRSLSAEEINVSPEVGGGIGIFYEHHLHDTTNLTINMQYADDMGYEYINWNELDQMIRGEIPTRKRVMLVGFDSAYISTYNARDIINQHDFKPNLVLIYNDLNGITRVSKSMVQELLSDGYSISSYAYNNPADYATLNYEQRITQLNMSIINASLEFGQTLLSKTFPYGSWNKTTLEECVDFYPYCIAVYSSTMKKQDALWMQQQQFIHSYTNYSYIIPTQFNNMDKIAWRYANTIRGHEWYSYIENNNELEYINIMKPYEGLDYLDLHIRYYSNMSISSELKSITYTEKIESDLIAVPQVKYYQNISYINGIYEPSTSKLEINCNGTGYIELEHMNTIGDKYIHIHDGIIQHEYTTDNFNFSSCSEHIFLPVINDCYKLDDGNYTINTSDNLCFNLSNNAIFKYLDDQPKQLTITNTTVTATSISTPNSIFNSTTATGLQDQSSYTETMGAGTRTFIIGYNLPTDPRIISMATTITDISYAYTPSLLLLSSSGTGNIAFTNMSVINGDSSYAVYSGDTLIYFSNDNDYTFSGELIYTIKAYFAGRVACANTTKGFASLGGLLPLVALALIILTIVGVIMTSYYDTNNFGVENAKSAVGTILLIILVFGIVIIFYILFSALNANVFGSYC